MIKAMMNSQVFPPTGQRSVITVTSVIGHIFQLEFDGELSSEAWHSTVKEWWLKQVLGSSAYQLVELS